MRFFETIGSATIIAYDDRPILTTDPWITSDAYFGSWTQDYAIPAAQLQAICEAKYHWFSHGHPDHLNVDSLPMLSGQFLLSDHYGKRIYRELIAAGHNVRILPDWEWVALSDGIRVCSVANRNQDSMLLIDVNGRLVINMNDSSDYGKSFRVRRIAKQFKEVYFLQLHGWGGADMSNLFAPDGTKLTSVDERRRLIAPRAQRSARAMGAGKVIPFSSFHRYQRADSAWANGLIPELADYQTGAIPGWPEMLPAFVRVNCESDEITEISPPRQSSVLKQPEEFGDSWSDPLVADDKEKIRNYFRARAALHNHFGFVEVKAGGSSVIVDLNREKKLRDVGITFEAPRNSMMTCIEHEFFDDLLIGNFMRTTLHNVEGLYPNFTPYVAKYADNGGAKSHRELLVYFGHYYLRDPVAHSIKKLLDGSESVVRNLLKENTIGFQIAKRIYYDFSTRAALSRKK